jgi:hypothetical protein
MDYFSQFLTTICAGLGLFLAGAANLALHRKRFAFRAVATVLAIGIALAAAAAIQQPGTIAGTATLLAFGLVPFVLLGNRRLIAGLTAVMTWASRPIVCSALLSVAGIAIAIGSVVICERADDRASDQLMADMELIQARVPTVPVEHERVSTDRGTRIVLRQPVKTQASEHLAAAEGRYFRHTNLTDQVIREGQADERSNCHGWVFVGGRFILSGEDVDRILTENQYAKQSAPQPGDLAVYRNNGAVAHTAIVMYVSAGRPVLVRGKWGTLGVFLHPADKSPYGNDFSFYRSPRDGHRLVNVTANNSLSSGVGE